MPSYIFYSDKRGLMLLCFLFCSVFFSLKIKNALLVYHVQLNSTAKPLDKAWPDFISCTSRINFAVQPENRFDELGSTVKCHNYHLLYVSNATRRSFIHRRAIVFPAARHSVGDVTKPALLSAQRSACHVRVLKLTPRRSIVAYVLFCSRCLNTNQQCSKGK